MVFCSAVLMRSVHCYPCLAVSVVSLILAVIACVILHIGLRCSTVKCYANSAMVVHIRQLISSTFLMYSFKSKCASSFIHTYSMAGSKPDTQTICMYTTINIARRPSIRIEVENSCDQYTQTIYMYYNNRRINTIRNIQFIGVNVVQLTATTTTTSVPFFLA